MEQVRRSLQHIMIFIIYMYRVCIRPVLPPSCRFHPSCSEYAIESIKLFGVLKGSFCAFKRIIRCHPWSQGGSDPVPPSKENI